MPMAFTSLPSRAEIAQVFAGRSEPLMVLEVGVLQGGFSEILASTLNIREFHLVDPWEGVIMSGDQDGNNVRSVVMKDAYESVKTRFIGDERVVIHRQFSYDAVESFADGSFDLIYLDADHSYKSVKQDLELYFPKLKDDGWIVCHDYEMNALKAKNYYDFGVRRAVSEFCLANDVYVGLTCMDGCVSAGITRSARNTLVSESEKCLVYFTVGVHPGYVELTRLCIESMMKHGGGSGTGRIDIMVMCDEAYRPHVEAALGEFGVTIWTTGPNADAQTTSKRKVDIFDYARIDEYTKVLYLDSDIVVRGGTGIRDVFQRMRDPGALYTCSEYKFKDPHRSLFYSLQTYTREEIARLTQQKVHGFNCGQFAFFVNDYMRTHFRNVSALMWGYKGTSFYEQSFMNVYFNARGGGEGRPARVNDTVLTPLTNLDPWSRNTKKSQESVDFILYHFANHTMPWGKKLDSMRSLLKNDLR